MLRCARSQGKSGAEFQISASAPKGEKAITKLIVRADGVQIKIEVTPVLRGCVYEPKPAGSPNATTATSSAGVCRGGLWQGAAGSAGPSGADRP
jgi:hypothetical protein